MYLFLSLVCCPLLLFFRLYFCIRISLLLYQTEQDYTYNIKIPCLDKRRRTVNKHVYGLSFSIHYALKSKFVCNSISLEIQFIMLNHHPPRFLPEQLIILIHICKARDCSKPGNGQANLPPRLIVCLFSLVNGSLNSRCIFSIFTFYNSLVFYFYFYLIN